MSWDYRVVRKRCEQTGDEFYAIHEVFFDEEDRPWGCTIEPVLPIGESLHELTGDMVMFITAILEANQDNELVIDYDLIPEEGAVNPADAVDMDRLDEEGACITLEEVRERLFENMGDRVCCGTCYHWRGKVSGKCLARPLGVRDAEFEMQHRYATTDKGDWCARFKETPDTT